MALYTRQLLEICAEEPNPSQVAMGHVFEGWSLAARGMADAGCTLARAGIEEMVQMGQRLGLELMHGLLADAYEAAGDLDGALRALGDGEDACPDHLADRPGTLERRAEILAKQAGTPAEIDGAFAEALAAARRWSAKFYELRAATGYAHWLCGAGRRDEARELLVPLYASFSEGFDSRDLREARELLERLLDDDRESALPPGALETAAQR